MQYWADLQSMHGLRCYDNMRTNAKCQRVLVLALCLVYRRARMSLPSQQTDRRTGAILCTVQSSRRLIAETFDDWDSGCHVWYTRPVPSLLYQTSDQGPLMYQLHIVRYVHCSETPTNKWNASLKAKFHYAVQLASLSLIHI